MNNNIVTRNQNDPYLYCDFEALINELRKVDLGALAEYDKTVIAAVCDLPQAAVKYIDKIYGIVIKQTKCSSQSILESIINIMFVEESEKDWCKLLKEAIDTIDISHIQPSKFIKIKDGLYKYIELQLNAQPYTIATIATTMYMDELNIMYDETSENVQKYIMNLRYDYNRTKWKQFIEFIKKNGDTTDYTTNVLITLESAITRWGDEYVTKTLLGGYYEIKNIGYGIFCNIINEYFNDERYSAEHEFIDDVCFGYPVYYYKQAVISIINNICSVSKRIMSIYNTPNSSSSSLIHPIYKVFEPFADNNWLFNKIYSR